MTDFYTSNAYQYTDVPCGGGLVVVPAGFEDRAFRFLSEATFSNDSICILYKFVADNENVLEKYQSTANNKFNRTNIYYVELDLNKAKDFERSLSDLLKKLPRVNGETWVDISGMPTFVICSTLRVLRDFYPSREQTLVYTAASDYFPTQKEYLNLKSKHKTGVEFLPKSMAREMSEVLLLEGFSGHRSKNGVSCLVVFAGYDAHRSAGVIESVNPSALLLLYGDPGDESLGWRLDLSKQLHSKFESTRKTATEDVSTLQINDSLQVLEEYYEYLYEDFDLTISPICSKIQVVSTYLFWEKYPEVQLVFPLPIGYSMDRKPMGCGNTYVAKLPAKNSLYRQNNFIQKK